MTLKEAQERLNRQAEENEKRIHKKGTLIHRKTRRMLEALIYSYYALYGDGREMNARALRRPANRRDALIRFDDLKRLSEKHPDIIEKPKKPVTVLDLIETDIILLLFAMGDEEADCIAPAITDMIKKSFSTYSSILKKKPSRTDLRKIANELSQKKLAGRTPEESIYERKNHLSTTLSREIEQGIMRGEPADKIARLAGEKLEKTARKELDRLVYTEDTFLMEETVILALGMDFEKYEYVTAGDNRVCDLCRGLNGKVFMIADKMPGLNAPPMHPWCRCRIRMHVDDFEEWIRRYTRFHGCSRKEAEMVLGNAIQ